MNLPTLLLNVMLLTLPALVNAQQSAAPASATVEPTKTNWKGFERDHFLLNNRKCFVTKPAQAAAGNPWVWRARFPGYHDDVDVLLLKKGFHIAHINTGGAFGSPKAMTDWDAFYDHVRKVYQLAEKVGLEGVSRGGLFMYTWAKRIPARVACIYGDTPVCDIKSWPLGEGMGKGSEEAWVALLNQYDFTDGQARAYDNNPIDGLRTLVEAGIPILHIVSEDDEIVPPKENTYILQKRYHELGGTMNVISVPHGTVQTNGHHFKLKNPAKGAAFFVTHCLGK